MRSGSYTAAAPSGRVRSYPPGVWFMRALAQTPEPLAVLLLALFASGAYLLVAPFSNFASASFLDPWIYTGYFTNFSYLLRQYGVTYYVSRLPWIVPGLAVFHVAEPAAASIILNAAIIATSAASLYWIVRRHSGPIPAVLAAVALAVNPYFIYTVAWDYPDGPAIAYAFVAAALYLRPNGGSNRSSFLAGVFVALSGYTNLAAVAMLGSMLIIPFWPERWSIRGMLRQLLLLLGGGAAATAVLAVLGKLLLNQFVFFTPQIGQLLYAIHHPNYLPDMWGRGSAFLLTAYRLGLPVFLLVTGAILAARLRKRNAVTQCFLFLVLACLLFSVQEFVLHGVALRVPYHCSYLIVPLFCMVGMVFGEVWKGVDGSTRPAANRALFAGAIVCGFALPFGRAMWPPHFGAGTGWLILALAYLLAGIAAIAFRGGFKRRWAASVVILTAVFAGPAIDSHISYPWTRSNDRTFASLMDIQNLIKSTTPPDRHLRFWFDGNEADSAMFHSAASLYLWGYYDLTRQLPGASWSTVEQYITPDTTVVHLTADPDKIAARLKMLEDRHISVNNQRRWRILGRGSPFYIELDDVAKMNDPR